MKALASGAVVATLAIAGTASAQSPSAAHQTTVQQYCISCHNQRLKTGGLALDVLDIANVRSNAETWEQVVRKLRVGAMPPHGARRPDQRTTDGLIAWLEGELDRTSARSPGRPVLRRLNRAEYANAIRDLLALDVDVASLLPPDVAAFGFDNVADAQGSSPALLQAYLAAARKISAAAVGDPRIATGSDTYTVRQDLSQDVHLEGLPLGTVGGMTVRHTFPVDGEYEFQVRLYRTNLSAIRGLEDPHELDLLLDGQPILHAAIGGEKDLVGLQTNPTDTSDVLEATRLRVRRVVKAGQRDVAAAFLDATPPLFETNRLQRFIRDFSLLDAMVPDRAATERQIRVGADVNVANRYGVTPLSLAAQRGHADLIALLLKAGASVKTAEAKLPEGQTLLMLAARTGNVALLKSLIAAGSNVNARETRTGTTAAVWAATSNRADAIRLLAEAGADLNVLSKVTAYPHTQAGVLLSGLEEGVSYVGQTVLPRGGWSAVMYTAREGAVEAARALADSRANLNLTDPEGTTALIIAIINGHYDVASVLIEKGADPNIADIKGMTPLYAAVDMHTIGDTFGRPYPPRDVIEGSLAAARMLLTGGANPNARLKGPILKRVYDAGDNRLGEGATPFMRAARKCDVAMMQLLLEAKADVTLTQKSGNTPVMLCAGAVSAGNSEDNPERVSEDEALPAIRLALDAGVDVNAANATGDTALHTASTTGGGLHSVIRLLVERGGRLDAKNKAERTPLDAATRARQPNERTIALLKELAAR